MIEVFPAQNSVIKILGASVKTSKDSYIWSIYLFPFTDKGEKYIFHNLTRQCMKLHGGEELPSDTKSFTNEQIEYDALLKELRDNYYLVPEGLDETALYMSIYRTLRINNTRNNGFKKYTILPTTACNARCFYCYEKDFVPVTMTDETVEQTIEFIKKTHCKNSPVRISWFGGEPLVGAGIIDRICKALADDGIAFDSSMVTNGILIDDYIASQMKGLWNLKKVQISLDGVESEYNKRKNYIKHYDSPYQTVMESIGRFAGSDIRVSLRVNTDLDNVDTMREFVDDVYSRFGASCNNIFVYFSSLYQDAATPRTFEVRKKLEDVIQYSNKLFVRNRENTQSVVDKKLLLRTNQCIADNAYDCTVITPDGLLYKCEHIIPGTSYGNIWDGVTDKEFINRLLIPTKVPEKCYGCPVLPECTPFDQCPIKHVYECRKVFGAGLVTRLKNCINGIEEDDDC